jgi:hypothetical protein
MQAGRWDLKENDLLSLPRAKKILPPLNRAVLNLEVKRFREEDSDPTDSELSGSL